MFNSVMASVLGCDLSPYDISPGVAKGENWISTVYKLKVKNSQTHGFFIKCLPTCEHRKTALQADVFFKNEVQFYNNVLPEFLKFQEEKSVKQSFESVVKVYYTSVDRIVLEDLTQRRYTMLKKRLPLDKCHLSLVLKELGRFHGFSIALKGQQQLRFSMLKASIRETIFNCLEESVYFTKLLTSAWNAAMKTARKTMMKEDLQKIELFFENALENVAKLAVPEEPYAVILHGDLYVNNILFHYPSNMVTAVPDKMCFIDFQMTRYGSPALDLSFLLLLSVSQKTRQDYKYLLRLYHDSLSEFVRQLGSNPEDLFPFSALEEEMKKYSAFGMAMALVGIPGTVAEESGSVNLDSDCKDAEDFIRVMCSSFDNTSEICERKVVEVMKEAVDHGYIR